MLKQISFSLKSLDSTKFKFYTICRGNAQINGSALNGFGAFGTGLSLLGFGPVGWIAGSALMTIGIGATAFGINEVVSGIVGENSI